MDARKPTVRTERVVITAALLASIAGADGCDSLKTEYVYGGRGGDDSDRDPRVIPSSGLCRDAWIRPGRLHRRRWNRAELEGNTFMPAVRMRRPADAVCAQVIRPYVTTTESYVADVPAGAYTVVASDVSASFELLFDNTPQRET